MEDAKMKAAYLTAREVVKSVCKEYGSVETDNKKNDKRYFLQNFA